MNQATLSRDLLDAGKMQCIPLICSHRADMHLPTGTSHSTQLLTVSYRRCNSYIVYPRDINTKRYSLFDLYRQYNN